MNILIVVATQFEIKNIVSGCYVKNIADNKILCCYNNVYFDVLITGIGIYNTVYNLTKTLNTKRYDFVINAGIAGAFSEQLNRGDVVEVVRDAFGDVVIFGNNIQNMQEYGLWDNDIIFNNIFLENGIRFTKDKKKVNGVTVNSLSFDSAFNNSIKNKFGADIETMEGAAFFYVCMKEEIMFSQFRAISNYTGEKDKSKWDFDLAIINLEEFLFDFLKKQIISRK